MKVRIHLTGTAPLLMHNVRLADPLDPYAIALKKVSNKRVKTEDDHAEMARIEWYGGLYHDDDVGPYVPGFNVERALRDGAKITRQGKQVERGLLVTDDFCPVIYVGPRDLPGLWADKQYTHRAAIRVAQARVMRTRPVFPEWQVEADAEIDPGLLSVEDLQTHADAAGSMAGLGDWRPRYGRFTATIEAL